jgi:hypothetical protein
MGRKVYQGGGTVAGNIAFTSNTISTTGTNQNLVLDPAGTGVVTTADPMTITNATASSSSSTGALVVSGGLGVAGNLYVAGNLNGGVLNSVTVGQTTPAAGTFTNLTVSGLTTVAEMSEVVGVKTGATGVVTHDFTEANIFYHSSMAANFTMNLTNVPTTNDRTITVNLVLIQGGTARYASAFQIDGVSQTIRWAGYTAPTPQANRYELQTFTLVRSSSNWTVFGSLASFG